MFLKCHFQLPCLDPQLRFPLQTKSPAASNLLHCPVEYGMHGSSAPSSSSLTNIIIFTPLPVLGYNMDDNIRYCKAYPESRDLPRPLLPAFHCNLAVCNLRAGTAFCRRNRQHIIADLTRYVSHTPFLSLLLLQGRFHSVFCLGILGCLIPRFAPVIRSLIPP